MNDKGLTTMTSLPLSNVLLVIIPYLVWFFGAKKKIPVLVLLAGILIVATTIVLLYPVVGMTFTIILSLVGIAVMIGGAVSA